MLSTFEAENRHLDKHTEPQLKKRCAYKKKDVYAVWWQIIEEDESTRDRRKG